MSRIAGLHRIAPSVGIGLSFLGHKPLKQTSSGWTLRGRGIIKGRDRGVHVHVGSMLGLAGREMQPGALAKDLPWTIFGGSEDKNWMEYYVLSAHC
jgi:hypothetical protein